MWIFTDGLQVGLGIFNGLGWDGSTRKIGHGVEYVNRVIAACAANNDEEGKGIAWMSFGLDKLKDAGVITAESRKSDHGLREAQTSSHWVSSKK